jgi:hypothetical protein
MFLASGIGASNPWLRRNNWWLKMLSHAAASRKAEPDRISNGRSARGTSEPPHLDDNKILAEAAGPLYLLPFTIGSGDNSHIEVTF